MPSSGYATISSERTCVNLFPGVPFKPEDFYWKASQGLQEQQQRRVLQQPSFCELQPAAEGSLARSLTRLHEVSTALDVEVQCTIQDPVTLTRNLTSSRFCSKQTLKGLTAMLMPAASRLCDTQQDDGGSFGNLQHHLLCSLRSRAVTTFEDSCEIFRLQAPLLPHPAPKVTCFDHWPCLSITCHVQPRLGICRSPSMSCWKALNCKRCQHSQQQISVR